MNSVKLLYLEWDSNFFSKNIYKAKVDSETDFSNLSLNIPKDADLIYIFASSPSEVTQRKLVEFGAKLIDEKVTYRKKAEKLTHKFSDQIIFENATKLSTDLLELVYQSGEYSRFKLDIKLQQKFEAMYLEWINKSLKRELADEVFIAKYNGKIAGFVTIQIKDYIGSIGLIAVNKEYRSLKIGTQLLAKAENFFINNNIKYFEVVTQLYNSIACSFYEIYGFRKKSIENIYHYWIT